MARNNKRKRIHKIVLYSQTCQCFLIPARNPVKNLFQVNRQ